MADVYLQVTTTTESQSHAQQLARSVVQARLAACVQVLGPIASTYWWEGEIEDATEWLCLMKTTAATYPALEAFIQSAHTYEVPEITASPITMGSAGYLSWISGETGGSPG
ncbi:MAG TPA: divalent-cation tolerance protein CutA [Actinomycetota bacterium]|nr:divalent-cation tolerance protein CutA [Actinomycetota bacterium]